MTGNDAHPTQRLTFFVKSAELTQRVATATILLRHDLSYAQLGMVLSIARMPGLSGAALARMHGITAQSAGEVIATLVRRDLVVRHPDPGHARILTAHLSDAGHILVVTIQPELDAIERRLTRGLSKEDLAAARRVLAAIVANGGTIPAEGH